MFFPLTGVIQPAQTLHRWGRSSCSPPLHLCHSLLIHQPQDVLGLMRGWPLPKMPFPTESAGSSLNTTHSATRAAWILPLPRTPSRPPADLIFPRREAGLAQICNPSFLRRGSDCCMDRERKRYQLIIHDPVPHEVHQFLSPICHQTNQSLIVTVKENNHPQARQTSSSDIISFLPLIDILTIIPFHR